MIRVLIADDHAIVRSGFRQFVADEPDMEVAAEASTGDETIALVRERATACVLGNHDVAAVDGHGLGYFNPFALEAILWTQGVLSAESRAAMLLIAKGFRIATRRFKTPVGEIDIVARRRRDLVFVEVKARENLDDAAEAVTERAKQRIIAAGEFWLASHPDDAQCFIRFDVILVAPGKLPRHIANAFDASR